MNTTLRRDADEIIRSSIQAVLPDEAVRRALKAFQPKGGRVLLVTMRTAILPLRGAPITFAPALPAVSGQAGIFLLETLDSFFIK